MQTACNGLNQCFILVFSAECASRSEHVAVLLCLCEENFTGPASGFLASSVVTTEGIITAQSGTPGTVLAIAVSFDFCILSTKNHNTSMRSSIAKIFLFSAFCKILIINIKGDILKF